MASLLGTFGSATGGFDLETNAGAKDLAKANALGAAIGIVGNIGGSLIGGGYSSKAGSLLSGAGDLAGMIPGPWGMAASGALKVVGGITDRAFGSKMNQQNISEVENNIAQMRGFNANAGDFDQFMAESESAPSAMTFSNSFIGKDGWFGHKARRKARALRKSQAIAAEGINRSLLNNAENLIENQFDMLDQNYAAFGGHLETHGNDWSTGLKYIGNGGSHEQNPNDGVQMGIAPDGQPNLVEEGEAIFNDYVFSKRINVPKKFAEKYKIKGKTFADAAMDIQKEFEEMPNDPIAKRGFLANIERLQGEQEEIKAKRALNKQLAEYNDTSDMLGFGQMAYAKGGKIHIKPGNRGKFTALKKRTGKSASWFKAHGTPAQKKMATFALNAKKWKHAQGGHLYATPFENDWGSTMLNLYDWWKPWEPSYSSKYEPPALSRDVEVAYASPENTKPVGFDDRIQKAGFTPKEFSSIIKNLPSITPKTTVPISAKIPVPWEFYSPTIGSGIQAFTDLMGWTNKPNYSSANSLIRAASNVGRVRSTPIGNYMAYRPVDRLLYANQLAAQAGATRRNILNTSGGNRGMAIASLLAADRNAQDALGQAIANIDAQNYDRYKQTKAYNAEIDKYNSANSLQAQSTNLNADLQKLNMFARALAMKDEERRFTDTARSTNLTNFYNNLAEVGKTKYNRNQLAWLAQNGYFEWLKAKDKEG